jgi:hypothetical protein
VEVCCRLVEVRRGLTCIILNRRLGLHPSMLRLTPEGALRCEAQRQSRRLIYFRDTRIQGITPSLTLVWHGSCACWIVCRTFAFGKIIRYNFRSLCQVGCLADLLKWNAFQEFDLIGFDFLLEGHLCVGF